MGSLKKLRIDNCIQFKNEDSIIKFLRRCNSLESISFAGNAMYTPPITDKIISLICPYATG